MAYWGKLSSKIGCMLGLSLLLSACTTKTTEHSQHLSQDFPQGKQLEVEVTSLHTEQVGIISKITYATADHYRYEFRLLPNDIPWKNMDDEPKQLLVCADNSAYLHSVRQQANPYYATTTAVETKPAAENTEQKEQALAEENKPVEPYVILKNHYTSFVDKRYFFKLLGEYYWVEISKDEYSSKLKDCQAYAVPNENYYQTVLD